MFKRGDKVLVKSIMFDEEAKIKGTTGTIVDVIQEAGGLSSVVPLYVVGTDDGNLLLMCDEEIRLAEGDKSNE